MGNNKRVDLFRCQLNDWHGSWRLDLDQILVAQVAPTFDLEMTIQCIHSGKGMMAPLAGKGSYSAMQSFVAILVVQTCKLAVAAVALEGTLVGVGTSVRGQVVRARKGLGTAFVFTLVDPGSRSSGRFRDGLWVVHRRGFASDGKLES